MPSIRQSIRSSTASKRPTSAIADGQIALNTASGTPGIFFKDNANNIIKAGPAHYGASAPNSSPAVGGSTGNSIGEAWLDSSLTPAGWKIWNGSAWVNATPLSSDTVQGLVELATNAEVQAGVDTARAVTAAGLQSKVSDSISTTSSSGIASSSAVKTAYDLANAALPKSGGIITGNLEIGSTGSFTFEGATADGFETTLAVVDPTADRTITFPDITGTVITTADTGTVTSTMIANGTIVDADINSSAAIAFSKLASLASANILIGNASGVPTGTTVSGDVTITNAGVTAITSNAIVNADINSAAAIAYSKLALASGIVNTDISASAAVAYSKLALSNSIVNVDINSAAAIAGTKISPDFGSQNLTTTGNITATNHIAASGTATTPSIQVGNGTTYKPGVYSPGTDQVAISTNGTGRVFVDASGNLLVATSSSVVAGYKLQVNGSCGVTSTANAAIEFGIRTPDATFNDSYLSFGTPTQNRAQIYCTGGAANTGSLAFNTFNAGSGAERMRLTSAGLLGLGTSSPNALLDVNAGSAWVGSHYVSTLNTDYRIRLRSVGAATNNNYTVELGASGSGPQPADSDLTINTQTWNGSAYVVTEKMRVTATGNVGIGTTSPSTILDVNTSSGASQLRISNGTYIGYLGIDSAFAGIDYASQSGGHRFRVGASFTEAARIDSSGRLLVGTSSWSVGATAAFVGNSSSGTGNADVYLSRGLAATGMSSGQDVSVISFSDNAGGKFAQIGAQTDGTPGSGDYPGRLVFSTTADGASSPTERMRITNDGNALLGSTNPATGARLYCTTTSNSPSIYSECTNASFTSSVLAIVAARDTTNGSFKAIEYYNSGAAATRFFVNDNGNVQNTNNSYTGISDIKLKENIVDANSQWNDIKNLQVRNYNFKIDQTHRQIGLIAQEVELVSPGLVADLTDYDREGNDLGTVTKSVNYSVLYMKAVKALQEAMERIETLEASNADMLARVTALEAA
jgi:hypothetical protein